jgi:hypothetical protein
MEPHHPITPPRELVQQWGNDSTMSGVPYHERFWTYEQNIATAAAQWGSDQELEACCSELDGWGDIHYSSGWKFSKNLRTARRPKPPNLKELALEQLQALQQCGAGHRDTDKILRALEALPND